MQWLTCPDDFIATPGLGMVVVAMEPDMSATFQDEYPFAAKVNAKERKPR